MTSFPQLTPEQEDKLFAMKIEWQRQKDYRDRSTEWVRDDKGGRMYVDISEVFGQ